MVPSMGYSNEEQLILKQNDRKVTRYFTNETFELCGLEQGCDD